MSHYRAAAVRVRMSSGIGGSGVVIGHDPSTGRIIALTNHHVAGSRGSGTLDFADGRQARAQVVASDQWIDLSAMLATIDWTPTVAPLHHGEPDAGDAIVKAGYGGGRYREIPGTVKGIANHHRRATDLAVTPQSISGDSGGPIYTPEGDVAAILWGGPLNGWGGSMIHTQGARTTEIRKFVETQLIDFPWCRTKTTRELEREIATLKAQVQSLERDREQLQAVWGEMKTAVGQLEGRWPEIRALVDSVKNEDLTKLAEDIEARYGQMKSDLERVKTEAEAVVEEKTESKLSGVRGAVDAALTRLSGLEADQASLVNRVTEAVATARGVGDRVEDVRERVTEIKSESERGTLAALLQAGKEHAAWPIQHLLTAFGVPSAALTIIAWLYRRRREDDDSDIKTTLAKLALARLGGDDPKPKDQ